METGGRSSADSASERSSPRTLWDPIHHERIDRLLDVYARKLAENINKQNAIAARVPSILVAGGSNFPVRKKEKQNQASDAAMKNSTSFLADSSSIRFFVWRIMALLLVRRKLG